MKQRKLVRTILYGSLCLWAFYLLLEALEWSQREDYLFPLVSSALLIVLLLVKILSIWTDMPFKRGEPNVGDNEEQPAGEDEEDLRSSLNERLESDTVEGENKRAMFSLVWILAIPVILYALGTVIGIVVVTLSFTYYLKRSIRTAVFMTISILVVVYVFFLNLLGSSTWDGYLIDLLASFI